MADFIQLKKRNTTKIGIKDANGKPTGDYLEFDFEDIELPLKWQEVIEEHKNNVNYIKMQFKIIEKRPDKKGKKLLSVNEEEEIKLLKEFYRREAQALNKFLGENGVEKLLQGSNYYYEMFDDINEYLKPILPTLDQSMASTAEKIKNKYKNTESNVI